MYQGQSLSKDRRIGERVLLINRTHRGWLAVIVIVLVTSSVLYVIYARAAPNGPSGGSWQGLMFGVIGALCMIYAGLLSGRKSMPGSQLGSVQFWLKGHLWVGALSVPMIFFHTGFRFGGLFEQILMICFLLVILSGVYGLVLQQFLPRLMSIMVPSQAIAEQVPIACVKLLESVDRKVFPVCSPNLVDLKTSSPEEYSPERALYQFYQEQVRTFLVPDAPANHPLVNRTFAVAQLSQLEGSMPVRLRAAVKEIQVAYEERRQLMTQTRLHFWLHHWLFVHIPLSVALLVLGIVHAAMSVYY